MKQRTDTIIIKIALICAILITSISIAGAEDFFNATGLIYVLCCTLFMTLAGFSISDILNGFRAVFTQSADTEIMRRALTFWTSFSRNLIVSGVLGTVTGFVHILASMDDVNKIGPAMSIAYITVFYGILFSIVLPLPSVFIIKNQLKDIPETPPSAEVKNVSILKSPTFITGTIFNLLFFTLICQYPQPNLSALFHPPSHLIVIGIASAFVIFTRFEKGQTSSMLTAGLAVAGVTGATGGIIQMLKYLKIMTKIGPAAAFAILTIFTSLTIMVLISFPLSDRFFHKSEQNSTIRLIEFIFPAAALMLTTITMLIIFTIL